MSGDTVRESSGTAGLLQGLKKSCTRQKWPAEPPVTRAFGARLRNWGFILWSAAPAVLEEGVMYKRGENNRMIPMGLRHSHVPLEYAAPIPRYA